MRERLEDLKFDPGPDEDLEIPAEPPPRTKFKAAVRCANCERPLLEHCTEHMIPCCPGRCPKESTG